MKTLTLSLLLALLSGCKAPKANIQFVSEPAGARVFYGAGANEGFAEPKTFLGLTPFTWETDLVDGKGRWKIPGALVYSTFVPPCIVFRAEPGTNGPNLFPQRVVFHGGQLIHGADKAPPAIFFDLTKPAAAK